MSILLWAALASPAFARPGLIPSTATMHDTRASSIGLEYASLHADFGTGHTASYTSNFSSTTSRVSAQFGLHYLTFAPRDADGERAHGAAGSSMTVFALPVGRRFDNGLSRTEIHIAPGLVPTVLVGRNQVEIDIPLVVRMAVPISPLPWMTLAPWVEGGFDLAVRGTVQPPDEAEIRAQIATGEPPDTAEFSDVLSYDLRILGFARGGLQWSFHLGKRVDINLHAAASTVIDDERTTWLVHAGGALRFHWDKVVPDVLPPAPPDCAACARTCGPPCTPTPLPGARVPPEATTADESGATEPEPVTEDTAAGDTP